MTSSPPLPLAPRHPLCKCIKQEIVLASDGILEKDCDKCNKNSSSKKNLCDAQTSPQISPLKSPISPASVKVSKKQLLSPSKFETPPSSPHHPRAQLEKSNSLGESKPAKQLRTTKSLSPRPPMRHQAAVNDENNVVNIKVSPADDDACEESERRPLIKDKRKGDGIVDSLRFDELQKNRSTSCLVYVPSDPWTKMDQQQQSVKETTQKKRGENRMKKLMDVKSLSKPDLIDANDSDPWVLDETRKSRDTTSRKSATIRHQSKSLHIDSKSGTARPRLQRSRSPKDTPLSPKDPLSSLSPTLGYNSVPDKNRDRSKSSNGRKKQSQQQQQFLNVSNPNLLQQPRHSFSTSPTSITSSTAGKTKDDELTLNIRRLSEQIKYSSTYGSYGNFHHATSSTVTSPKQIEGMEKSASLLSDSLLETTC